MSLYWFTTADWAPSDWVEGMQPNGFRDSTMWPGLCSSSRCSWPLRGGPRRRRRASCSTGARCAAARTGRSSSCGDVAERLAQAVILAVEDRPRRAQQGGVLLAGPQLGRHALVDAPGGGHRLVLGQPSRSVLACLAWWIMYMIQVPIGSTRTCAPSRSRNGNMLKLPSPSVVCAQNSPVILTMGFTRSAVDAHRAQVVRHLTDRLDVVLAEERSDELAGVLRHPPDGGQRLEEGAHAAVEPLVAVGAEDLLQVLHRPLHRPVGRARPRPRRAASGSRRR